MSEPKDRFQHQARYEADRRRRESEVRRCPYCGRVMSNREAAEQGACNDCHGGAA